MSDPIKIAGQLAKIMSAPKSNDVGRGTGLMDQAYTQQSNKNYAEESIPSARASEAAALKHASTISAALAENPELAEALRHMHGHVMFKHILDSGDPASVKGGPESPESYQDLANESDAKLKALKGRLSQ